MPLEHSLIRLCIHGKQHFYLIISTIVNMMIFVVCLDKGCLF